MFSRPPLGADRTFESTVSVGCSRPLPAMGYPSYFMLVENKRGNYSFLKGIAPYSAGVVAEAGFEVVHVRLRRYFPLQAGFDAIKAHLKRAGRPLQAMCGMECGRRSHSASP